MPVQDPIPNPPTPMIRLFWRTFRLLALLSVVVAGIAVLLVARGDAELHINMLVATGLGTAMTMLVGTALMTLLFLSSSSGHDQVVSEFHEENDEE